MLKKVGEDVMKRELLEEQRSFLVWVQNLERSDEKYWFQPFSEGKWGMADIISHFIMWDRFFLDYRFPYIRKAIPFPKLDINSEKMNKDASVYARSGISKQALIKEYIQTKELVIAELEELSEDVFSSPLKIGKVEKTVLEYFESHLQHDRKHKQQIVSFLEGLK